MNDERLDSDLSPWSQLERLACGDLPDDARRPLLAWLEADPLRWRLFGLVALEAQTVFQALADFGRHGCVGRAEWTSPADEAEDRGAEGVSDRTPDGARPTQPWRPPTRPARHQRAVYAAVLAASVVVAFALGLSVRGAGSPADPPTNGTVAGDGPSEASPAEQPREDRPALPGSDQPVLASLRVRSGLAAAATVQVPVRPVRSDGVNVRTETGLTDYLRAKWRRQGYDLNVERRYLFANLADGTPIVVPIEQVSLHRVATPVH